MERLAVVHQRFNRVSVFRTGETLFFGFYTFDDRHCKVVFTEIRIHVEHADCLFARFLGGGVDGVPLLPQKFAGTQKRTGGLFPAHHGNPLIVKLRQIAVRMHDCFIVFTEQGFGGRAHAKAFFELFIAAVGNPGDLGRETLNVVFFFIEQAFRNKHRHADIFMSERLKLPVELFLNIFPNGIAVGADDHTAFYAGVFDKLCLFHNVGIPFCEIFLHRGDFFNHFFLLCHVLLPSLLHCFPGARPERLSVLRYISRCRRRF